MFLKVEYILIFISAHTKILKKLYISNFYVVLIASRDIQAQASGKIDRNSDYFTICSAFILWQERAIKL